MHFVQVVFTLETKTMTKFNKESGKSTRFNQHFIRVLHKASDQHAMKIPLSIKRKEN